MQGRDWWSRRRLVGRCLLFHVKGWTLIGAADLSEVFGKAVSQEKIELGGVGGRSAGVPGAIAVAFPPSPGAVGPLGVVAKEVV